MDTSEKIRAAMYMIFVCANEDLTHAEKTKILKVAYRLLRAGIDSLNEHVFDDKATLPF